METKVEYGIASVSTGKVVPVKFETQTEAEIYRSRRVDPAHWKVVSREVTYGEWK